MRNASAIDGIGCLTGLPFLFGLKTIRRICFLNLIVYKLLKWRIILFKIQIKNLYQQESDRLVKRKNFKLQKVSRGKFIILSAKVVHTLTCLSYVHLKLGINTTMIVKLLVFWITMICTITNWLKRLSVFLFHLDIDKLQNLKPIILINISEK